MCSHARIAATGAREHDSGDEMWHQGGAQFAGWSTVEIVFVASPGCSACVVDVAFAHDQARDPSVLTQHLVSQPGNQPITRERVTHGVPRVRGLGSRIFRMVTGVDIKPRAVHQEYARLRADQMRASCRTLKNMSRHSGNRKNTAIAVESCHCKLALGSEKGLEGFATARSLSGTTIHKPVVASKYPATPSQCDWAQFACSNL